jgi:cation-transporting ATPase E
MCHGVEDEEVGMASDQAEQNVAQGLTAQEVAERVAHGLANDDTEVKTKSVRQIVAEHSFTLFNGVNLAMAALVLFTGQFRNLLFLLIVGANLVIGVFQEIRAKKMVDKLRVLTTANVRVRREGKEALIPAGQIVLDDVVLISHGDQVPADALIISGDAAMNESLLTGESNPVEKKPGDHILSGSFVDSGSAVCRVERVGKQGYAAHINAEAKYVKAIHSEIKDTIDMVVRLGTYALVPLGSLLFLRTYLQERSELSHAILTTVSAVIAMIPQGLVLLTSAVLAIATIRLARRHVLIQQAYCIETLARVDTLCLDKTGTITTGQMEVRQICGLNGHSEDEILAAAACIVGANAADANETAQAISDYVGAQGTRAVEARRAIPFSSRRKYSGCTTVDGTSFVMGAVQNIAGKMAPEIEGAMASFDDLERLVVVAEARDFTQSYDIVGPLNLLGIISIRDQIRPTAAQTLSFFKEQGVEIRVISGDDPRTVSAIASKVGVPGSELSVDASTLTSDEQAQEAVKHCKVFGRVTPEGKRRLLRALKNDGHTVAMTGDGVNDILALREADCSVAMASGSAAARNIAEIVLADDDFAHMPEIVAEGRRSINNLERSASLFLVKTVYAVVVAFICIFLPPYPFIPIQASLLSGVMVGLPSFVLALESNHDRVKGSFLEHVLSRSLPASLAITGALFVSILVGRASGWSFGLVSTVCMILVAVVGTSLVWRISQPLNRLRRALLVTMVSLMVIGCTVCGQFFEVADLMGTGYVFCAVVGLAAIFVFLRVYDWSCGPALKAGLLRKLVVRVEASYAKRNKVCDGS